MGYLTVLGNGMNPSTPLSGCEINVHFCFVYIDIIAVMFFEVGGILPCSVQENKG